MTLYFNKFTNDPITVVVTQGHTRQEIEIATPKDVEKLEIIVSQDLYKG